MAKGFFNFFRGNKDVLSEEDQNQRNYALGKAKEEEALQTRKKEISIPKIDQETRPEKQERINPNEGIEVAPEIVAYCKDRLQELVDLANLYGTVEVVRNQNNTLVLDIVETEDLGRTIGKGGATLEALQTLVRTFAFRKFETSFRLTVDAGEYKKKKTVHSKKRYSKPSNGSNNTTSPLN